MKSSLALILFVSFIVVLPASADTKIKTKNTAMGHATESTVYIKGARKRDEMSFGPVSHVTILQCDQKRIITFCPNSQSYTVYHLDEEENVAPTEQMAVKPAAKQNPASTPKTSTAAAPVHSTTTTVSDSVTAKGTHTHSVSTTTR